MTRSKTIVSGIVILAGAVALAACGGDKDKTTGGTTVKTKAEAYCDESKFTPTLRHSFIVIDGKALAKTQSPDEFLAKNLFFRELLLQLAGAERAIASGLAAPRERFTVMVLPADGSTAQEVFTGCVPGLTITEQKELVAGTGKLSEFMSGDPLDQVAADGEEFTERLLGGVFKASELGSVETGGARGPFGNSPFLQGLAASRQLLEVEPGIARRVFLVSDFSRLQFGSAEGETSPKADGIAAGRAAAEIFRLAEVYVVQPKGTAVKGKAFVEGFIAGQGGKLVSFASGMPSVSSRPPVSLAKFAGEVRYASGSEPVEIVLGRDDQNKLAYSWFSLLGGNASTTPMTGTMVCQRPDSCTVQSDNGGFAQSWKTTVTAGPQFDADMPLAGARIFKFSRSGETVTGEISDPLVQLGDDPSKPSLTVRATLQ
jgi:hypothetical protein